MKIIIGADLVPTKSNEELFASGNAEVLVGKELLELLSASDTYSVFNLETPLCDFTNPILKNGPNLSAPTSTISGYTALGVKLLTLANNHILDQGEQGLESTLHTLKINNIPYLGVGKDLEEAIKPYIFDFSNRKVGIYACVEHEFSVSTDKKMGANPFEPLETFEHIEVLKEKCDYVIVLYHGGKEHYRYPSPNLQKVCRKLVDKGADLVVCQHSHCVGCEEKYGNGTIVYGQGNFLFDHNESEFWQTSLLVDISSNFEITYIPLVKCGNKVRVANAEVAEEIMNGFSARSEEIKCSEFVSKEYARFAEDKIDNYLISFSTIRYKSLLFRVLNKLTGYRLGKYVVNKKYKKHKLLALQNYIECEAHRELLLEAIRNRIKG